MPAGIESCSVTFKSQILFGAITSLRSEHDQHLRGVYEDLLEV